MIFKRGLLRIYWHQTLPATMTGILGLSSYSLAWPEVMTSRDSWPWLLLLLQCLLLAVLLGRFQSSAFAFLYSRGYSRDSLWAHMMLVSFLSIVVGWLPAALIVWTGLRSLIQDRFFYSPYFPIMAPYEIRVPFLWLAGCLLLTAAFHYVWIRRSQPIKGQHGGDSIGIGLIAASVTVLNLVYYPHGWIAWLLGVSYAAVLICLILGGLVLHRSSEVRT
jgi:hypothetical protein